MQPVERKNQSLFCATRYAMDGMRQLLRERSAQRELAIILAACVLYGWSPDRYTFTLVVLSFVLLAMESLNTAIEAMCDHVTPEIHPAIKKSKDLGAAAIFIISVLMGVVAALFIAERLG